MKKGVDISEHNGIINFEIAKDYIDFAIIRVSFGKKGIDKTAIRNIENCIKYNIPFGCYLYSYALNLNDAVIEANNFLKIILPYKDKISIGACIDMEDADLYKKKNGFPTNEMICEIVNLECRIFENAGLRPIIYASSYWFNSILNSSDLDNYTKWIAWWNENAKIDKNTYKIWQYTSKGHIAGIEGSVDLNMIFDNLEKTNKELLLEDVLKYPEYTHETLIKLIENDTLKGTNGRIELNIESVRLLVILDRNKLFES